MHIKYHCKQGAHFSSSHSFFWDKHADQKFQENEIRLALIDQCAHLLGRAECRLCRCKGLTAATRCFPNPIKNATLKGLWGRRLCEDEGVREREECRFHWESCLIISPESSVICMKMWQIGVLVNLSGKSHFGRMCLRQDFTPYEHGEHIFCRVPVSSLLCRGRMVHQSDSNPRAGRTHCRAAVGKSCPDPTE